MLKFCIYLLSSIPIIGLSQSIDSTYIHQVDSLIKISRGLTEKSDFEQAMQLNTLSEKIALEKIGKETAAFGKVCSNYGRIFIFKGNYQDAEKWYQQTKEIREKALGKEHPDYAWSLFNLAAVYSRMGQNEKAELFYLDFKAVREKTLGKEHPDYAMSLYYLGNFYRETRQNTKAEAAYLEAKEIQEKVLGKEHPDYASVLNNLAILNYYMGQYEKAEPLYLESKAIREKALGKEHPDYGASLNNLAALYMVKGEYAKAEPLYLESKVIQEKMLGKEHPNYVWTLNNLSLLYYYMNQFEKAVPLALDAIAILKKNPNKENAQYASSLNNLGILYKEMGQYEKAEPLFLESKAIREKVLGKEHPDYASSLNNLALLYIDEGQFERAEPLYLESKAIRGKTVGKEHPDYAQSLNNLALLYYSIHQYEKVEALYLEALAIQEKSLGKENAEYAKMLYNLGLLYNVIGQYDKAEPIHREVLTIREKLLGKEHSDYGESLNALADLYFMKGQNEKAETLYVESKSILEKALGKQHQYFAEVLNSLASLYSFMGQYEKAESLFISSAELMRTNILSALHHLSEPEMNKYLLTFNQREDNIFSFNQKTASATGISKTGYDNTLFFKGFLLNAYQHSKKLILSNAAATEKFNLLMTYGRLLAAEYAKPLTERKGVTELEEKSNTLEKELARAVSGYGEAMKQVKWQDVQQKLKKGEAAVEFVNYRYIDKNKTDSTMYAAFLLRPGDPQPQFIPLFEEKSIDSLLPSSGVLKADYVNRLYSLADRGAEIGKVPRRSLYEILWKPLEKELVGIKRIYFSPAGLLHRINIDAIPVSETETLADRFQMIELNSSRQLVIPHNNSRVNNKAVEYGGIRFNSIEVDSSTRGETWSYLPGTEREVNSLEKIMLAAGLQTTLKKGSDATEESFKKLGSANSGSPRVLHIATHGYFFPDPKVEAGKGRSAAGDQESVFKMSDHPMLRSGLILAGGNVGWQGKRTLEGKEDGVLTAYEISQMNLSNTELVVLSACETGLGSIQGNEGVYGLQRAFKIAGAKYLIMSLWQVPDKQTSLLMLAFYKKWLGNKMPIPKAFHEAQKQLRKSGLDPYYWAGFVLVE